jgi:hypothetical protein
MKKLLALLVIAGSITAAQAQNWTFQNTDATDGSNFYIDTTSMVYSNNKMDSRSVWLKQIYRNGNYDMHRYEVHCSSKMFRFLSSDSFGYQNTRIGSIDSPSRWLYNMPGTVADHWSNTVCKLR